MREAIDCSICVAECHANAIVEEGEISPDQAHFVKIKRDLSQDARRKSITQAKAPLPNYQALAKVKNKLHFLEHYDTEQ